MPTPSGGDWARGSRGGGLRAPAGRGSAGVILLGDGSPDLTACGWGAGVHGRCMLVIWRAASRRIKGPRGPRRLTPHAMRAPSACATSACGHVGMRHSGGVPRGDSRTSRRRSRRRICSVPSSSSQCASARSTRRSTCPQLACACCGLNERLFASRQCKAQITLSARIAELWPRASSSRSVAPCRSKEALPTRMAGRRSPTRLSRSLGSSLVDAASCRNTTCVSPRPP
jgi:hypothetical protein